MSKLQELIEEISGYFTAFYLWKIMRDCGAH